MGVIVQFNYDLWAKRYPEFATVDIQVAQSYFDEATMYHRNDGGGPVSVPGQQALLLNMLTAHIAQLYLMQSATKPASQLVGRISSASEGSVSVQTDFEGSPSADWFLQTKYGTSYYAATRQFRSVRYRPFCDVRRATH